MKLNHTVSFWITKLLCIMNWHAASKIILHIASVKIPTPNIFPLPSPLCAHLLFTPWWKQTPKYFFHPVQWISQMNTAFSPSFTVTYVYFVLDLQQPVSHLHRLSSVGWVNESVRTLSYLEEQTPYVVTSEQANHSDCWTDAGSNSLCSFTLQNS